jgi:hypothetical protein
LNRIIRYPPDVIVSGLYLAAIYLVILS